MATEKKPTQKSKAKPEKAKPEVAKAAEVSKPSEDTAKLKPSKVKYPTVQDLFKAGAQFGHETSRWNPKMKTYIYDSRSNIHIIDVTKTEENLKKAGDFLRHAASKGPIIFVGTKRQAAEIVRDNAIKCGAMFVTERWAGGSLTNFQEIKKSLRRLLELEKQFEEGVEGRTKYEISLMKKDWQKLNRLYGGIKRLESKPSAVVIVDSNYEKGAVREANHLSIPVVAIVDSNSDPDSVMYPIPANDDAISSIELIIKTLAEEIGYENKSYRIVHNLKDYSKAEVKITKSKEVESEAGQAVETDAVVPERRVVKASAPTTKKGKSPASKGILGRVQEEKEKSKSKK